jgi:cytochrome c oxidase subunit 4
MTATAHEEKVHGAGHKHPTDRDYMVIALILAVITAGEVALYYWEIGGATVPTLLVMMVAKFFVVAGYFMHLKFDSPMFTRFFVAGMVLAIAVYMAALSAMQYFGDDTTSIPQEVKQSPAANEPSDPGGE